MVIDRHEPEELAKYFLAIPEKTTQDTRNKMFIRGVMDWDKNNKPDDKQVHAKWSPEKKADVILTYMINSVFRTPGELAPDSLHYNTTVDASKATGLGDDEGDSLLLGRGGWVEKTNDKGETEDVFVAPKSNLIAYDLGSNKAIDEAQPDRADTAKVIYKVSKPITELRKNIEGEKLPAPGEWKSFLKDKLQALYPSKEDESATVKVDSDGAVRKVRSDKGKQRRGNFQPATPRTEDYDAYMRRLSEARNLYNDQRKGIGLTPEQEEKANWYKVLYDKTSAQVAVIQQKALDDVTDVYTNTKGEAKRQAKNQIDFINELLEKRDTSDVYRRQVENRMERNAARRLGRTSVRLEPAARPEYHKSNISSGELLDKAESAFAMLSARTGKDYSKQLKAMEKKLKKRDEDNTYLGGLADSIMSAELGRGIKKQRSTAERLGFDTHGTYEYDEGYTPDIED